eukprot:TRINITY_DN36207_c0_g1_i1.p1 TRINITY_DN36207_c0_g1~~TRINITY_DN36207_c0_g1_i1.p1  ORF type:complete len:236 (+),score=32.11 TRINITY_DN36207_c0_g1_i1:103-810(+)
MASLILSTSATCFLKCSERGALCEINRKRSMPKCRSAKGHGRRLLVQATKHSEEASPVSHQETVLQSVAAMPVVTLAAAEGLRELLEPLAEEVNLLNLPDWLVHWGHPGNMAVVLLAMGGYGTYLGWQIRISGDKAVIAAAKDLHPKLLGGLFFFFALGATGGVISLVTQGLPIFESPHAVTGILGLGLLGANTALTTQFENDPNLRNGHAYLGTATMLLFLVHAAFGLRLGLSF